MAGSPTLKEHRLEDPGYFSSLLKTVLCFRKGAGGETKLLLFNKNLTKEKIKGETNAIAV